MTPSNSQASACVTSPVGSGARSSRLPVRIRNYLNLLGAKRGLLINLQQSGKKPGETKLEIREVTP